MISKLDTSPLGWLYKKATASRIMLNLLVGSEFVTRIWWVALILVLALDG